MPTVRVPAACAATAPSPMLKPPASAAPRCVRFFVISAFPVRHGMPVCRTLEINPLAGARLGRNRHRRQILKPALGLYEPAHFGRHGPRIEVVDDKDHDRQAA